MCGFAKEDMVAVNTSLLLVGLLYTEGASFNIAFIVYLEDRMIEKCIAIIQAPPPSRIQSRMIVTRFWCRRTPSK
ncbi:uncharacterized protein LOC119402798 isoform X2 [Rhipicephalus sanguineus]|uniref:uncharacterized protein LOC119402798 isoform X2 n=1 Tax=Rhipicephalus sanguineus TaxID=34632 RepID=UPI001894C18F|nr:uncharacterized protein LOC119402798 isoform X2 [Rhipicephalus sanguineus]